MIAKAKKKPGPARALAAALARLEKAAADLEVADHLYPDACGVADRLDGAAAAAQALADALGSNATAEQLEAVNDLREALREAEAASKLAMKRSNRAYVHSMGRASEALRDYATARLRFVVWVAELPADAKSAGMANLAWMDRAAKRLIDSHDDPGLDPPWEPEVER